jgi:hypothetical protein
MRGGRIGRSRRRRRGGRRRGRRRRRIGVITMPLSVITMAMNAILLLRMMTMTMMNL